MEEMDEKGRGTGGNGTAACETATATEQGDKEGTRSCPPARQPDWISQATISGKPHSGLASGNRAQGAGQ